MRDYKITRNKGEMYNTIVTDSYGNKYQNYFETAHKAKYTIMGAWIILIIITIMLYNTLISDE